MRRNRILILVAMLIGGFYCCNTYAQSVALKTNALYDLTGTLNLGGELACGSRQSVQLSLSYNPWEFGNNKKMKLFQVQPEFRYWFDEVFFGAFVGVEAHYALYNMGGMTPFTTVKNHRYQGTLGGAGLTCGYQWMLSAFWSLEASLSLGYSYLDYKKYGPAKGDALIERSHTNYWGPTHIGLSFVYFIQ